MLEAYQRPKTHLFFHLGKSSALNSFFCLEIDYDLDTIGEYSCTVEGRQFTVQIIDPVKDYVELMKQIFDFKQIKSLVGAGGPLKVNTFQGSKGIRQILNDDTQNYPFCRLVVETF